MLSRFTGNVGKLNSDVLARSVSLHESTSVTVGDAFEFGTIENKLSEIFVFLGCVEIGGGGFGTIKFSLGASFLAARIVHLVFVWRQCLLTG